MVLNASKVRNKMLSVLFIIMSVIMCFTGRPVRAGNGDFTWVAVYNAQNLSIDSILSANIEERKYSKLQSVAEKGWDISFVKDKIVEAGVHYSSIYPYSFNGVDGLATTPDDKVYAKFLVDQLTNSFNLTLQEIIKENKLTIKNVNELQTLSTSIANCVFGESCEYKGINLNKYFENATIDDLEKNKIELGIGDYTGASLEDFRILKTGGNRNLITVSLPKGYHPGQRLYEQYGEKIDRSLENDVIPKRLNWNHLVYSANINAHNNRFAGNTDEFFHESKVEGVFTGFFINLVDGLAGILGLFSIEELMLNRGLRDSMYYKGIANQSWFSAANFLYWIAQIITLFVIVIGIVKMFINKTMNTFNPNIRASLKESLIDLLWTIIMMATFMIGFALLAQLNYTIVKVLSETVDPNAKLAMSLSGGAIATLLVLFAQLFISLKINVTYLLRSVTIMLLYITAPFFIGMMVYGKKGKELFRTWLQQLIGNIFMQTMHAIVLVLFLHILSTSSSRGMERIMLLYSFIPLTQLFKDVFLGQTISDSASRDVANSTNAVIGQATNATLGTIGMVGAVTAGVDHVQSAMDTLRGRNEDIMTNTNPGLAGSGNTSSGGSVVNSGISIGGRGKIGRVMKNFSKDSIVPKTQKDVDELHKTQFNRALDGKDSDRSFDSERLGKKTRGALLQGAVYTMSKGLEIGAATTGLDSREYGRAANDSGFATIALGAQALGEINDYKNDKKLTPNETLDKEKIYQDELEEAGVSEIILASNLGNEYIMDDGIRNKEHIVTMLDQSMYADTKYGGQAQSKIRDYVSAFNEDNTNDAKLYTIEKKIGDKNVIVGISNSVRVDGDTFKENMSSSKEIVTSEDGSKSEGKNLRDSYEFSAYQHGAVVSPKYIMSHRYRKSTRE